MFAKMNFIKFKLKRYVFYFNLICFFSFMVNKNNKFFKSSYFTNAVNSNKLNCKIDIESISSKTDFGWEIDKKLSWFFKNSIEILNNLNLGENTRKNYFKKYCEDFLKSFVEYVNSRNYKDEKRLAQLNWKVFSCYYNHFKKLALQTDSKFENASIEIKKNYEKVKCEVDKIFLNMIADLENLLFKKANEFRSAFDKAYSKILRVKSFDCDKDSFDEFCVSFKELIKCLGSCNNNLIFILCAQKNLDLDQEFINLIKFINWVTTNLETNHSKKNNCHYFFKFKVDEDFFRLFKESSKLFKIICDQYKKYQNFKKMNGDSNKKDSDVFPFISKFDLKINLDDFKKYKNNISNFSGYMDQDTKIKFYGLNFYNERNLLHQIDGISIKFMGCRTVEDLNRFVFFDLKPLIEKLYPIFDNLILIENMNILNRILISLKYLSEIIDDFIIQNGISVAYGVKNWLSRLKQLFRSDINNIKIQVDRISDVHSDVLQNITKINEMSGQDELKNELNDEKILNYLAKLNCECSKLKKIFLKDKFVIYFNKCYKILSEIKERFESKKSVEFVDENSFLKNLNDFLIICENYSNNFTVRKNLWQLLFEKLDFLNSILTLFVYEKEMDERVDKLNYLIFSLKLNRGIYSEIHHVLFDLNLIIENFKEFFLKLEEEPLDISKLDQEQLLVFIKFCQLLIQNNSKNDFNSYFNVFEKLLTLFAQFKYDFSKILNSSKVNNFSKDKLFKNYSIQEINSRLKLFESIFEQVSNLNSKIKSFNLGEFVLNNNLKI